MSTSVELIKKIKKDHGENIALIGRQAWVDMPRLPTGIFPVDLAMGGGFIRGKVNIVYGPESSNKTNLLLGAVREGQKMHPGQKAVIIDAEHDLNIPYAESQGVDPDRLIILYPEHAEMAVDFVESFLYAEDIFCVGLDSIAALTKQSEVENDASKNSYGGASILVGKLMRKAVVAFSKMQNSGIVAPAFVAINQIRFKMDAGPHGNPETMPGGQAQKYAASMILRTYAKNVMDTKLHPSMPVFKEGSIIVKKWKCPILAVNAEYKMQMIKAGGHNPGYVKDWNTVSTFMQELEYLSKRPDNKPGWIMCGDEYPTLKACEEALYSDPTSLQEMKSAIIKEMLDKAQSDEQKAEKLAAGDHSEDIAVED
jgi:recombination protein RecA